MLLAADRVAAERGMSCLCVQYLPRTEAELLVQTGAMSSGDIILQNYSAWLTLCGTEFEEYRMSVSYNHRRTVLRDLRRFENSGCKLEISRLSGALDIIPRLSRNVQNYHGSKADEEGLRRMLEGHCKWLDGMSIVIVVRGRDGDPIACTLSYIVDDTLYVRLTGLDYDRARESASYFVAAYYEPIRQAYRKDLKRVHWGIGALKPKVHRGARLEPLYGFFRGRSGTSVDPQSRLAAEARLRAHLKAELGGIGELPDAQFF
jgi:predicted N-acyltransferase